MLSIQMVISTTVTIITELEKERENISMLMGTDTRAILKITTNTGSVNWYTKTKDSTMVPIY